MPTRELGEMSSEVHLDTQEVLQESVISFHAELSLPLQTAMLNFIKNHPNWDQYRLIQAALAGFLVQNGVSTREITRLYIGNMFASNSLLKGE